MESFLEKFSPKNWDRVFGHPLGQMPGGGIEPAVFRNWYKDVESRKEMTEAKQAISYEKVLAEAERQKEAERRKAVKEQLKQDFAAPRSMTEELFVKTHIRVIGQFFVGAFNHKSKRYKSYSPNKDKMVDWLLRKGKEVGRL